MDCREVRENLPLYVDGTIEEEKGLEVERHLIYCEQCRAEMEKYIEIREAMRGLEELPLPEGYEERLKEKLDNGTKARPLFAKYVAVAAAFAVMFSSIYMMDRGNIKEEQMAAESIESLTDTGTAAKYPDSSRPEMAKSSSQSTKNEEENGNGSIETNEETQSAFPEKEVAEENTKQNEVMADSENSNQSTGKTAETYESDSNTNTPEQKYGIASGKPTMPEVNGTSVEELIRKYDGVILQTAEEDGYTVITVKVDIDKEEQLISELSSAIEKTEKDNDSNLKIFLRSDLR